MGQSADEVSRSGPVQLREGEAVVIRPGMPPERGEAGAPVAVPVHPHHAGAAGVAGSDDPAAIEAGIEQTRAEMSGTIDAIQQRLSPENLKEEAKETVSDLAEQAKEAAREAVQHAVLEAKQHAREALLDARYAVRDATIGRVEQMARTVGDTTEDARYGLVETIKQNPFPAALAGIGLAWLFMNRQSAPPRPARRYTYDARYESRGYRDYDERYDQSRAYGAYSGGLARGQESPGMMDRAQEKVGQVAGRAGDMASQAGETLGQAASTVGETASRVVGQVGDTAGAAVDQAQETTGQLVGQAQYQMQRAEDRVGRALQENPLAIGAVALALGTAVGLAVPQTRKEHELFGQARDTLVERAQGLAQETIEKVQQVAQETGHTVQREAEAQGLVGR